MLAYKDLLFLLLEAYSGVQISWQRIFLAGNQGNHHNFDQSLLTYKRGQIFMAMKPTYMA